LDRAKGRNPFKSGKRNLAFMLQLSFIGPPPTLLLEVLILGIKTI